MSRYPNPLRLVILAIGLGLARLGLIDRERAVRTTDLVWPRIVTGLARMSKSETDIAMVGVAVGTSVVAGVGFVCPFYGLAFVVGGGVAGDTIALVSQRYAADAREELGLAVRASTLLVVLISLPVTTIFWLYPHELISLLSSNERAIALGARYLGIVAFAVPFAGLNLNRNPYRETERSGQRARPDGSDEISDGVDPIPGMTQRRVVGTLFLIVFLDLD